ncbi:hypothetical protein LDENG_00154110 [Lucifuga dentata]|nr:hypothetical protein LDENG_00154110 [Lucifuga dentata]
MKWNCKKKKKLELEQLRQKTEFAKLELQHHKLTLVKEGKLFCSPDGDISDLPGTQQNFDIISNLRLLPKFSEKDPDTFFSLFERIADVRNWPDTDRTIMLQCVLTVKAQKAYSALSPSDCQDYIKVDYIKVKTAVL